MKPQLHDNYTVSAYCSTCKAVTHFNQIQQRIVDGAYAYNGIQFRRVFYIFLYCARCNKGALATVPDNGAFHTAALESFFPICADASPLPNSVPQEIVTEFREAESCATSGANRAASALFRSVLEKTLKANGYVKGNDATLTDLQKRIDAAAADGVITSARKERAHDNIRVLGNDVLHDDWRKVDDDEVVDAHRYMQRILEDFYDDRQTVEKILIAKKRISPPQAAKASGTP